MATISETEKRAPFVVGEIILGMLILPVVGPFGIALYAFLCVCLGNKVRVGLEKMLERWREGEDPLQPRGDDD